MGGVAPGMIKEMLEQGKGYMMGDTWSMGDFEMSESTLSVEVRSTIPISTCWTSCANSPSRRGLATAPALTRSPTSVSPPCSEWTR